MLLFFIKQKEGLSIRTVQEIIIKNSEFICCCDIAKSNEICYNNIDAVCKNIHDKLVAGFENLK